MKKFAALLAGSLLALSSGAGIAAASVSATELQQMISSQVSSQVGAASVTVACPGDLATDLGASITCAVTVGDETRGVTVTVASVENGEAGLSLSLAQQ